MHNCWRLNRATLTDKVLIQMIHFSHSNYRLVVIEYLYTSATENNVTPRPGRRCAYKSDLISPKGHGENIHSCALMEPLIEPI